MEERDQGLKDKDWPPPGARGPAKASSPITISI